jgi:hypothetical protein
VGEERMLDRGGAVMEIPEAVEMSNDGLIETWKVLGAHNCTYVSQIVIAFQT